jgi:hypothetical protein
MCVKSEIRKCGGLSRLVRLSSPVALMRRVNRIRRHGIALHRRNLVVARSAADSIRWERPRGGRSMSVVPKRMRSGQGRRMVGVGGVRQSWDLRFRMESEVGNVMLIRQSRQ